MTGRERFLAALDNKKPDRLPCQVHSWMVYYLKTYLKGCDQFEAYEHFGMDPVIYCLPRYTFDKKDLQNWQEKRIDMGMMPNGYRRCACEYTTPKGVLRNVYESNQYTTWEIEHIVKTERDMEIFLEYFPYPSGADWTNVTEIKKRIGDSGITRGHNYNFGQPGVWQSYTCLVGTENAILAAMDEPEYVHHVLSTLTKKSVRSIEMLGRFELDLIENGGGGASSTVISPAMHKEFCLPYDAAAHDALKNAGTKVVYHLCGGLMPLLETVVENHTDALETMTPPGMGGDCDMAEATRRVGDKIAFIGGFDQNAGFEKGNPDVIREQVHNLFQACPDGGYICSPSDHFFFGETENVKAFVEACRQCKY
jgi:uroporphyrinogen-III decarboxylase